MRLSGYLTILAAAVSSCSALLAFPSAEGTHIKWLNRRFYLPYGQVLEHNLLVEEVVASTL